MANPVVNGSFEDGITEWSLSGNIGETGVASDDGTIFWPTDVIIMPDDNRGSSVSFILINDTSESIVEADSTGFATYDLTVTDEHGISYSEFTVTIDEQIGADFMGEPAPIAQDPDLFVI